MTITRFVLGAVLEFLEEHLADARPEDREWVVEAIIEDLKCSAHSLPAEAGTPTTADRIS